MRTLWTVLIMFLGVAVKAQSPEEMIRAIYDEALTSPAAYDNLYYLCKHTRGRICGSPEAAEAVEFTRQCMLDLDVDTVYLQPLMVKRWVRGKEYASVHSQIYGSFELSVCALGMSGGTGSEGITGSIIEVKSIAELKALKPGRVEGKIVFYNRPMDPTLIETMSAYGKAVDQRATGPAEAEKMGAIAVLVRSMTTAKDDVPHTGSTYFAEGQPSIPALAVSTLDADQLSAWLTNDPSLSIHLISTCRQYPDIESFNVIGEIRGSVYPDQIITVGGHLDAWDTGEGAHDDGAGCIQSIEVLRLFKTLGIHPKRTLRAVMFMDEEVAQRGAQKYFELAKKNNEKNYAALEADRGALVPVGFGFTSTPEREDSLIALSKYFAPYGLSKFRRGGGGADIGPLGQLGTLMISYIPDEQRYFDFHHSANDNVEQVHPRELQLGSAAMASLIYLIDLFDL